MNKNLQCICCEKKLELLSTSNITNGNIIKFSANYGSIFDLKNFKTGICDNCLKEKLFKHCIIEEYE